MVNSNTNRIDRSSNKRNNSSNRHRRVSGNMKSRYKGVRMRSWGSWVSEIRAPNQKTRIWLGSYPTPEAAARAYDAALLCLKGSSANLNFPDALPRHRHLPVATLMSPKSIQRVAAAAANSDKSTAPHPSPPPFKHPSPQMTSSPSTTSSEATGEDDHVAVQHASNFKPGTAEEGMLVIPYQLTDFWPDLCAFQSPKYGDQMLVEPCYSLAPSEKEEWDEGGIRLWSF